MLEPCDAIVLLSGGLDSATCLWLALREHTSVRALCIDYGQRHRHELDAAQMLAQRANVPLTRVGLDLRAIGGSALTSDSLTVPKDSTPGAGIPITYVPARNLTFLSIAAGLAEVCGASAIVAGMNAVDYSGYPDCRPEFVRSFEATARLATKAGVEGRGVSVQTPLMRLGKDEIIRLGASLGVPFEVTHSCYDPVGPKHRACGHCESCILRKEGFMRAGVADPTRYAEGEW